MNKFDPLVSADPREAGRALALYRGHIERALSLLRNNESITVARESERVAVFLESRRSPYAEFALRNVMHFLGEDWGLQIFVPSTLRAWILDVVGAWKGVDVPVIPPGLHTGAQTDLRSIAKLSAFWDIVKGNQQLFFNSEAMLCRHGIEEFLGYDYIGAPWPDDVVSPWCRVGSGGLSLRRKSSMQEICATCNVLPVGIGAEDVYFSINLHLAGSRYRLPAADVAARFAVERLLASAPLGLYRSWKFLPASELAVLLQDVHYE